MMFEAVTCGLPPFGLPAFPACLSCLEMLTDAPAHGLSC